ncbi:MULTISPECIES: hypothetical protein [unclassified Caballeronia]|uniref:hypothetical protein n=1 Tax=unclassified Caballeronia TaxID=2646786 RepID=UPI002028AFFF|nr:MULTISPECIES: hypothetical protein [unclassified Caballeronia]
MNDVKRGTLSLQREKPSDAAEAVLEQQIPVGVFDLLLPSRQFVVHHKVAVLTNVSLTAEFLLRLLFNLDSLSEEDIGEFFAFGDEEVNFIVNETHSKGYVERRSGRVELTQAGYDLFKDSDKPQVFEIVKRTEKVGFDLLSMAPSERSFLSEIELAFSELVVEDDYRASKASLEVPDAFRRHYREIVGKKDRDITAGIKRTLYSIDTVIPSDRFSSIVPVVAVATSRNPANPEALFEAWRTTHELDDRPEVARAVAAFLDNLKVLVRPDDRRAYDILLGVAEDYLKEYRTRNGLSVSRYFKEMTQRAGEVRADRPTIGIVGPLYASGNIERVMKVLEIANERSTALMVEQLVWVIPKSSTWGMSRGVKKLLERIAGESRPKEEQANQAALTETAITSGKPSGHVRKIFETIFTRDDDGAIPDALEILLIPQRLVAVIVHAPIGLERGFPVPLGILSFDSKVLETVREYLVDRLPQFIRRFDSGDAMDIHKLVNSDGIATADGIAASNSSEVPGQSH